MVGPLNSEQSKQLRMVYRQANILLDHINKILDVSKIDSGKLTSEPEEIQLPQIIKPVVQTLEPLISGRNIKIQVKGEENLPPAFADLSQVEQILLNLGSNAIKFMDEGSVTFEIQFSSRYKRMLEINVIDTGWGIPEKKSKSNFRRIFSDKTRKQKKPRRNRTWTLYHKKTC